MAWMTRVDRVKVEKSMQNTNESTSDRKVTGSLYLRGVTAHSSTWKICSLISPTFAVETAQVSFTWSACCPGALLDRGQNILTAGL